jgi:hypothetical protein
MLVAHPVAVVWQVSVPEPQVYVPPLATLSIAPWIAANAADSAAVCASSVVK